MKKCTPKKALLKVIMVLIAFAMTLGAFPQSAKAQYQPGEWLPFGEETQKALPEVSLLSANADEIIVSAEMSGITVSETELFGQSFLSFETEGYDMTQEVGAPALPVLNQLIEVPLGAEVTLELIDSELQTIKLADHGLNPMVAPVQPGQPKCGGPVPGGEPLAEFYGNGFYPESPIAIVDEFIMRGHRVVNVQVRPVRYNGSTGELETRSNMTFKLVLDGSDMELTIQEADRLNAETFNNILASSVLNYNQGRPVVVPNTAERILIITADAFESGLSGLVALKQSQGFDVSVVNLTTVGGNTTTAIKNYIKTQYQGAHPPVYVYLIGDTQNSQHSTWTLTNYAFKSSGGYGAYTDLHYFTMDSDSEFVPDILWGRFPVRELSHLQNMIANLQWFNQTSGDEAWVKKAEFLASDDSGHYQVAEGTHNYCIENYTLPRGYTGIFPNNPQPGGDKIYAITYNGTGANAIASINDNRSYIIYSGHGATTYWDAPRINQNDVRNLTGVPLTYVASHACITADYAVEEAFSDTWVIQNNKGGIVFTGASVSTYWDEDETMQKAIFDNLYADPTDEITPSISAMIKYGLVQVQQHHGSMANYYWEAYQVMGDPSVKILKGPKAPGFRVNLDPSELKVCNSAEANTKVSLSSINNFADPVALSASGMTGFTASFNPAAVTPPGNSTLTLAGNSTATRGKQTVTVKGTSGALVKEAELTLDVFPPMAGGPSLTSPADKAKDQDQRPTFRWTEVANVESYTLQIAKDEAFTDIVHERTGITSPMHSILYSLDTDKVFYWRVIAVNVCGEEQSVQTFSFRTRPGPGDCPEGTVAQREYFIDFEDGMDGWTIHPEPVNGYEWALSTTRAYSPVSSVLATVPDKPSDQRLDSPFFEVPSSPHPVAVLFMQRWNFDATQTCDDGGVIEYSEDNGNTWKAVPRAQLILNAYNGTVAGGVYNPLAGRQAWCGSSDWTRTVVDMKPFAGKTVAFRFRLGTGNAGVSEGWYMDDFSLQTCVEKPVEDTHEMYLPLILIKD